jgi:DNA-binding NarL/FixJ family response regulator
MRVVIAEDNPLLRDGIKLLLGEHDMTVVAAVSDAAALLSAVADAQPDAAVVDVRMPPDFTDEGVRAALEIRSRFPSVGVLVFSQWVETSYARRLIADNRGGVGYLLKDRIVSTDEFVGALHRVATGGAALDPEVVRQLLAAPAVDAGLARLTDREREILGMLAEGRSNLAIASLLRLADRSVEKHVTAIFAKLDLPQDRGDHRRVLAVLRYLDAGGQRR